MEKMPQTVNALENTEALKRPIEGIVVQKEDKIRLKEELKSLKKEIAIINETRKRVDLAISELHIPREAIPEYELEIAERPLKQKQDQLQVVENKLKGNKNFLRKMQSFLFGI